MGLPRVCQIKVQKGRYRGHAGECSWRMRSVKFSKLECSGRLSVADSKVLQYMKICKGEKLAPTLWRTCRALMNPLRLELLRMVFDHDDEYSVTEFSKALGIEQSTASIYLRQLNARGLIGVRRQQIKVFYNTTPDRSLPEALRIREAMRTFFNGKLDEQWVSDVMTVLRAFTHFNRLAMLSRLLQGPATINDLKEATGVCVKSLYHHLKFLNSADLLVVTETYRKPTEIALPASVHPMARVLLDILRDENGKGRTYKNKARREKLDVASRMILHRVAVAEGNPRENWKVKEKMKPRRGGMNVARPTAHLKVEDEV